VGFTVYWQAFMGVILVILVMVLPTGLVGTAKLLGAYARRRFAR
jgi:hypothetical protein